MFQYVEYDALKLHNEKKISLGIYITKCYQNIKFPSNWYWNIQGNHKNYKYEVNHLMQIN